MMVSFTSFANLALAATVGASPVATVPAVPAFVVRGATVDSTYAITEEQLKNYIAVKKGLNSYWQGHKDAFNAAKAKGHQPTVTIGQQKLKIGVFDYPEIVKSDTAVASIFTTNKFSANTFEPMQVAAFEAVGALVISEASKAALPANTTTLGKNVELVKAHRDELKSVGVALQVGGGMGGGGMGGMGGNDDLNP
jgi:hypothetical protein